MQRRVVLYSKLNVEAGAPAVVFGISHDLGKVGSSLVQNFEALTLDGFASANALLRHEKFDFSAGDSGARCALLEFVPKKGSIENPALPKTLIYEKGVQEVDWLSFPQAVRSLSDGTDKRYLQLAVQYISSGGVDDSVIASDFDQAFLGEMRSHLEKPQ